MDAGGSEDPDLKRKKKDKKSKGEKREKKYKKDKKHKKKSGKHKKKSLEGDVNSDVEEKGQEPEQNEA